MEYRSIFQGQFTLHINPKLILSAKFVYLRIEMRRYRYLLCFLVSMSVRVVAEPPPAVPLTPDQAVVVDGIASDGEKVSYLIGNRLGENLAELNIDDLDYESLLQGLRAARSELPDRYSEEQLLEAYWRYFDWKQLQKKQLESETLEKSRQFLAGNQGRESITTTSSGLQYQVMEVGQGRLLDESDWVRIRHQTKLADGTFISDSSVTPAGVWVPVGELIPAWKEALLLMPIGSRWILYAGPELTFGSQSPLKNIPANSVLVFDLELLEARDQVVPTAD